jgi:hypothetical protein
MRRLIFMIIIFLSCKEKSEAPPGVSEPPL